MRLCYKLKPIVSPAIFHAINYLEIDTGINTFKPFKNHNCFCIKLKNYQRLKMKSVHKMRALNSQERVN